jgi:hypothetical protein
MSESRQERGERLMPLAKALAERHNFTVPYYSQHREFQYYPEEYYAGPFMIVKWRDDPTDFDDGHGCRQIGSSEWADSPEDAVAKVRENLRYNGYKRMTVYDVERGEECPFEFGIRMKYKAVATLTATVGEGCFDNAPSLGGNRG